MFVIHGSSRQNGNTEALTHMMIDGIETEQIYLRDPQSILLQISVMMQEDSNL